MNRIFVVILKFVPVVLIVVASLGCKSGFSDSDIEAVKSSIRSEYEKRGLIYTCA
jgi:hypothetical protein